MPDQRRGTVPGWSWANLRHLAGMFGLGGSTATVYDSIGAAAFATAAPDWLNVGLWHGPGDTDEAPRHRERSSRPSPRGCRPGPPCSTSATASVCRTR